MLYTAWTWLDVTSQLIAVQLLSEPMMVKIETADASVLIQAELFCAWTASASSIYLT